LNEVAEIIMGRHSVRAFKPDPVPREVIDLLLAAGTRAPSAGNLQPWFFAVVENRRLREGLARAARQNFVSSAPVCLAVCAEPERSARVYGERGRYLYCYQDTAAAIQNILLTAAGLRLGSCWVGAFDEREVRRLLALPERLRPVALVPLGYPERDEPCRCTRRDMAEVVLVLR